MEVGTIIYKALRENGRGNRMFVGLPKGYLTREGAEQAIKAQKEFEATMTKDEYSSVKFIIRTYKLVSEEEV